MVVEHLCGAVLEENVTVGYAGETDSRVYEEITFYSGDDCVEVCPGCGQILFDSDCK